MPFRHVFISLLAACGFAHAQTFQFTAIPDQNTARLEQRFGKVARYLTETLAIDVVYVPVKSYPASVAAFKHNQVQMAWFGALSGVKARRAVPGSLAIAQGVEDQHFITYFIANTSTGLQPSEVFPTAIKGHTFTFGSKGSTSGRLVPEYYMRSAFHHPPEQSMKRVGFSGDHSKTIALVQSGSYQVGAVNYQVWESEKKAGKIDTSKLRVIWKTPPYPDYNWTIRGDVESTFGRGFITKVRQALLQLKDPDILAAFPRSAFVAADNNMYQPILDTALKIGIIDP